MSLPDRSNPYSFDAFLAWRGRLDYYADDAFLQRTVRHFSGADFGVVEDAARALSARASGRWRELADAGAVPERRPSLVHWDAHRHRVDRIVRPLESETMEREVFSEGLFSARSTSPRSRGARTSRPTSSRPSRRATAGGSSGPSTSARWPTPTTPW
jgi:hypothetical protein